VFFPHKVEALLKKSVDAELPDVSATAEMRQKFAEVCVNNRKFNDARAWKKVLDLDEEDPWVDFRRDATLTALNNLLEEHGKVVFGFGALLPFGVEARYGDFVQSDVYANLDKKDRAKYDVS
jgi:hypothetical protein